MFRLTVIEEPPLSSSEQKHREDDKTGAIPYSDGSHEQKRAGSADGGVAGPLDEAEERLTVDRSGHGEGDQPRQVSEWPYSGSTRYDGYPRVWDTRHTGPGSQTKRTRRSRLDMVVYLQASETKEEGVSAEKVEDWWNRVRRDKECCTADRHTLGPLKGACAEYEGLLDMHSVDNFPGIDAEEDVYEFIEYGWRASKWLSRWVGG